MLRYDINALRKAQTEPLSRTAKDPTVAELRSRALAKATEQQVPGEGSLAPPPRRVEFGEVETKSGRLQVAHDHEHDAIVVHGVATPLIDIDKDLRMAFATSSAAFSEAENAEEQASARTLIGLAVEAVLQRHEFLAARVRENKWRARWEV